MIKRLTIAVSVLTMLVGCASRERSSARAGIALIPSRTHRIALAELHRVIDAQAHAQAQAEREIDAHDAHPIVPQIP
jgi:hypothetical protein